MRKVKFQREFETFMVGEISFFREWWMESFDLFPFFLQIFDWIYFVEFSRWIKLLVTSNTFESKGKKLKSVNKVENVYKN